MNFLLFSEKIIKHRQLHSLIDNNENNFQQLTVNCIITDN